MSKRKPRPVATPAPFIPQLIDAHTHLASCGARTESEIAEIVAAAQAAGVELICTVGDGLAEAEAALAAAHLHPDVYAACAIHPTRALELDEATKARLQQMAADPRCVAIGETGLDTYWLGKLDTCAPLEVQKEAFLWHVRLAEQVNKPVMIHNREADTLLMDLLAQAKPQVPVMLHCFSAPLEIAQEAIARGYILSFAGNVTFKANDQLRQAAQLVPLDQLFIETDAPYMTPEPFRGSKNSPAIIGHTATCIADVRGMDVRELAAALTQNFRRIYQLPAAV